MKCIDLSQVPALVPLVTASASEPVFLTRDGRTIAAIVSTNDEDVESLLLSISPGLQEVLERSEGRLHREGAVSADELRAKLGLPKSSIQ